MAAEDNPRDDEPADKADYDRSRAEAYADSSPNHDPAFRNAIVGAFLNGVTYAEADRGRLLAAIKKHWSQRQGDRCWQDDTDLYEAAGLPTDGKNRLVGSKAAMRLECDRFIRIRCGSGGQWVSNAELVECIKALLWPNVPSADDVALLVKMNGTAEDHYLAFPLIERLRAAQARGRELVGKVVT